MLYIRRKKKEVFMSLKEKLVKAVEGKQAEQKKEWADYRQGKSDKPDFAQGFYSMPEEHYDKMFGVKPKQTIKKGGK